MTLVISKGITLRKGYNSAFADPDVQAYLTAVEAADGQALEYRTAVAIDEFVRGCKADGIWSAIKASCILAGARTLTGALVPLVGAAPTNVDGLFVSDDYNRKTGLVGDGSTKYLDSNRNNNADPQDSQHLAAFVNTLPTFTTNRWLLGIGTSEAGVSQLFTQATGLSFRSRNSAIVATNVLPSIANSLVGITRSAAGSVQSRVNNTTLSHSVASQTPSSGNIGIFARIPSAGKTDARLAFYSIGESLNLALLDARVTALINAFGAAIP
jgi:hypothetical protein